MFMIEKKPILFNANQYVGINGSPLFFTNFEISNKDAQNITVSYSFLNLTDKTIVGVYFTFWGYSLLNEELERLDNVSYIDIKAEPKTVHNSKEYLTLKNTEIRKYEVVINNVVFNDGTIWNNEDNEKCCCYPKMEPLILDNKLKIKAKELLQNKQDVEVDIKNIRFIPYSEETFWYCTCGHINFQSNKCGKCLVEKNIQTKILDEQFLLEVTKKEAEERREEIQLKKQELVDKTTNVSRDISGNSIKFLNKIQGIYRNQNANRNTLFIFIIVIFVVLLSCFYSLYNSRHNKFMRAFKEGQIVEVETIYKEMSSEEKEEVINTFNQITTKYVEKCKEDTCDFELILEEVNLMKKIIGNFSFTINTNKNYLEFLKQSNENYILGIENYNKENYLDALYYFKLVAENDKNYIYAQEYIEKCSGIVEKLEYEEKMLYAKKFTNKEITLQEFISHYSIKYSTLKENMADEIKIILKEYLEKIDEKEMWKNYSNIRSFIYDNDIHDCDDIMSDFVNKNVSSKLNDIVKNIEFEYKEIEGMKSRIAINDFDKDGIYEILVLIPATMPDDEAYEMILYRYDLINEKVDSFYMGNNKRNAYVKYSDNYIGNFGIAFGEGVASYYFVLDFDTYQITTVTAHDERWDDDYTFEYYKHVGDKYNFDKRGQGIQKSSENEFLKYESYVENQNKSLSTKVVYSKSDILKQLMALYAFN